MSSKALSPTASILRSSRLFSLPPPLPKSPPELTTGVTFNSDTATAPYPTHAAIVTTQSARSRGDWGLKRPLPLRSTTKTSTPVIRVYAVDSPQHITDFSSASDHVLTLEKWKELNLSLSTVDARPSMGQTRSLARGKGAFESEGNGTHHQKPQTTSDAGRRWKFAGPWLAGQTEGEFERYLRRQVRTRKREFREYLRKHLQPETAAERRYSAQAEGRSDGDESVPELSDPEVDAKLKSLRQDPSLSGLGKLIKSFLDLPSAYDEVGPPMMHPSGGLSYLRTHAVLPNHPLLGPQAKSPPVEARVLPRKFSNRDGGTARLGVAGVVTEDTHHLSSFNTNSKTDAQDGRKTWDLISPGGGKTWVHPTRATIDARGQIQLSLEPAQSKTVEIYRGQKPKEDDSKKEGHPSRPAPPSRSEGEVIASFSSTSKGGYGIEGTQDRRERGSQPTKTVPEQALETVYQSMQNLQENASRS